MDRRRRRRPRRLPRLSSKHDPKPVARSDVGVGLELQNVTHGSAWEQDAPGPQPPYGEDAQVAVEERDRELEAHPERVNGPRSPEQQRVTRGEVIPSEQPAHPFRARRRNLDVELQTPGSGARTYLSPHGVLGVPAFRWRLGGETASWVRANSWPPGLAR